MSPRRPGPKDQSGITRQVVSRKPEGGFWRSSQHVPSRAEALVRVTGCNSQLLVQLAVGGTTVVLSAFDVQALLRTIGTERINVLVSVPAIYALALAQPNFADIDVSRVSRVVYGGAPIAPSLVERIKVGFPQTRVGNGFGLTEVSSIATFLPHEWTAEHADSVGFAAPVVDLALDGADPKTGVGELLVRGPNVVAGYWTSRTRPRPPSSTAGYTPATSGALMTRGWSTSLTGPRT